MSDRMPQTEEELLDSMVGREVEVKRSRALWRGRVVAVASEPVMLIEQPSGERVLVALGQSEISFEPSEPEPSGYVYPTLSEEEGQHQADQRQGPFRFYNTDRGGALWDAVPGRRS